MKFAVIQFLGSNCDMDMLCALRDVLGEQAEYVPASHTSLAGFDAVMLPGGFSYGDYLRSGAIARFAPIMTEVKRFVDEGKLVLGTCNGFQILVEAGFLPGAFLRNTNLHFVCKWQPLRVVNNTTAFSSAFAKDQRITLPIAHGEGNYYCDADTLAYMRAHNQIVFTYEGENPNGSVANIAGITNERGNVIGMMPHPERACEAQLGGADGLLVFKSMVAAFKKDFKKDEVHA